MSKAEFNPKISSIPQRDAIAPAPANHGTPKAQTIENDAYFSSESDPYKELLSGQMKAETTPLQEMLGTEGAALPASKRRLSGMDVFLEQFLMGDQNAQASAADFETPYVPALGGILKQTPGIQNDVHGIRGIRDRYEGLEIMIQRLIAEADLTLRDEQTGYVMSVDQIEALAQHKKDLEQQLVFCQRQLGKAKFYLDWAKKGAKEAADKIKAESEWWNPDAEDPGV